MQDYLMRALKDDVGVLDFINVIRVITGKSMLHSGVCGEEHHGAKKKQAKLNKELEIDSEEDEVENEDVEVEEIIASYISKG
jgi:hypothetical protein